MSSHPGIQPVVFETFDLGTEKEVVLKALHRVISVEQAEYLVVIYQEDILSSHSSFCFRVVFSDRAIMSLFPEEYVGSSHRRLVELVRRSITDKVKEWNLSADLQTTEEVVVFNSRPIITILSDDKRITPAMIITALQLGKANYQLVG